jgi:hypothetical protein
MPWSYFAFVFSELRREVVVGFVLSELRIEVVVGFVLLLKKELKQ